MPSYKESQLVWGHENETKQYLILSFSKFILMLGPNMEFLNRQIKLQFRSIPVDLLVKRSRLLFGCYFGLFQTESIVSFEIK